jgi:hypothetical protein
MAVRHISDDHLGSTGIFSGVGPVVCRTPTDAVAGLRPASAR